METSLATLLQESIDVKTATLHTLQDAIQRAADTLIASLRRGKTIFTCGNGGSAGDAQHFASELINRFETERQALPAIDLVSSSSVTTAIANDYSYENVFSRQLEALARRGDVLLAFSTSGNSANVVRAIETAHARQMLVIVLTGKDGGTVATTLTKFDCEIRVPAQVTARIQEVHLLIIHCLCRAIDEHFTQAPTVAAKIQPSWEALRALTRHVRPLVFTNGVFDLIHRGHLQNLKAASDLGVCLIVGINSDTSVKTLGKGDDRPIQSTEDRMDIMAQFPFVDYVTSFDAFTPESLIQTVAPDILVKGGDYAPEQIAGYDFIQKTGGQIVTLPFVYQSSTTRLIEKIRTAAK